MSEEDEHANQNELSEEFIENFKENIFTHFFDDELEQKGLDRDDLEKGQVLLRTPFALSQFDDLETDESDAEVRINEDAPINFVVELSEDAEVAKGDDLYLNDINRFLDVLLDEDDLDAGHITYANIEGVEEFFSFDFRRNQSYYRPLIEASSQFIDLAEYAKEHGLWRGFVENAFHAAERMMKISVILLGLPAETHSHVQSEYSKAMKMELGDEDLYDMFNQLKDTYRFSASYVDPRGHTDEQNFEFDESTAESYLDILRENHDAIESGLEKEWAGMIYN